jgi:hypothetical protein
VLLQWTSGPDLNAFRGSLDELLTLTGGNVAFLDDPNAAALAWRMDALQKGLDNVAGGPVAGETMWLVQAVKALQSAVAGLSIPAPAPVDPATLKAVLLDPGVLAAIAKAVNDDIARRMAA